MTFFVYAETCIASDAGSEEDAKDEGLESVFERLEKN